MGIPRGAVDVEVMGRPVPNADTTIVNGRFRPVPGGVWETVAGQTGFKSCSLGFNATIAGVAVYLTASHCTLFLFSPEVSYGYQRLPVGESKVGVEFIDPPYFACNPFEPSFMCRQSDAAAFRYDDPNDLDYSIAQTEYFHWRGDIPGSFTIDQATPRWEVIGKDLWPTNGTITYRQGITTGWMAGDVTGTCIDVTVDRLPPLPAYRVGCAYRTNAGSDMGDSGGPEFRLVFSGGEFNAEVQGIHFAGDSLSNTT